MFIVLLYSWLSYIIDIIMGRQLDRLMPFWQPANILHFVLIFMLLWQISIIVVVLLKQMCLEMTLERAQSRIWCSKIGWQTVPCSWCIHGEAALTNSSAGTRDQQSPRRRGMQLLASTQVSQVERGCSI